ncbi:MAG: archaemetzincin family Zn-dependent metalloprotease [Candidatus Desulfofervidaceae bacterium]|nr:archaemetzincin family Zn-dependent metalloprotease [Candidatus Desulfofervidaceae bacterium]
MPDKIVLVRFEDVVSSISRSLKRELARVFSLPVEEGTVLPLPNAYDANRHQYLSLPFLESLLSLKQGKEFILGITEADLYAPGLNFIFGEAALMAGVAVISLARLYSSFYGLPEDEDLFKERVLKEAVHELGHLFGLKHCPNPHCVMHFSNSINDTDVKAASFCEVCKRKLRLNS